MTRVVLVTALATAFAQQAPPRDVPAKPVQGTAVVSGTVLAGETGNAPARRARVMLAGAITGGAWAVTTDDDGRFEFRDVPEGRYTIEVYKPGFLRSFYGASRPERAGTPIPVGNGARVSNLTIRISQGGAISGVIRDERGRPVAGVTVTGLRYGYSFSGDRRLSSYGRGSITDDRGVYRVWGLPPGEYFVAADPRLNNTPVISDATGASDFVVLTAADVDRALSTTSSTTTPTTPEPVPRRANYATHFFPGTADFLRAISIPIVGGEERSGIDLAISTITTARIRGSITMSDGNPPKAVTVTLAYSSEMEMMGALASRPRTVPIDSAGRFEFHDVGPGNYIVTAKTPEPGRGPPATSPPAPILYAQSPISVNGRDAQLQLQLSPAMTIAGRLVFQGSLPPPQNLTGIQLFFVPPASGGSLNAGPSGSVANDGTFRFQGVTPGPYRLVSASRGALDDWWVRTVTANGRDAFDDPIVVRSGEDVDVVITYTDKPTELAGVFQDTTGRAASEYFIVMFPADPTTWVPGSRRVRNTRPGSDGAFSIQGLPPGDYLVAALTDLLPEELNDRRILESLAQSAVKVTLVEGQTTRQSLRIGK